MSGRGDEFFELLGHPVGEVVDHCLQFSLPGSAVGIAVGADDPLVETPQVASTSTCSSLANTAFQAGDLLSVSRSAPVCLRRIPASGS